MLKTKTITTDKATLLVVELPEGAKNVRINNARGIFGYTDKINIVRWEAIEFGNWQLLGRLPDITEEQADKVVDEYTYNTGEIDGYYDYENDTQTDCPIESINSLMYTNEVYFENPLGDEPKQSHWKYWTIHNLCMTDKWKSDYDKWLEAQSKVWDKERCYLLIKEEYFYCKEWNNVGYICEEQCDSCRKTNDFKL